MPVSPPGSRYVWAADTGSDSTFNLTPLNFDGFYYDPDSGNYSQKLEITNISGRTIPANGLKYTAFVTELPFAVTEKTGTKPSGTNGSYKAVGFGTDKYAAINGNSSLLSKILIDNGTNHLGKKMIFQCFVTYLDYIFSGTSGLI